jgi:hypothetical protein
MGVHEDILNAPPSADLAPGQTDENQMGVTYDMVEWVWFYIYVLTDEQRCSFEKYVMEKDQTGEAWNQFQNEKKLIDEIHNKGKHKATKDEVLLGKPKEPSLDDESEIELIAASKEIEDFAQKFPKLSKNLISYQEKVDRRTSQIAQYAPLFNRM